MSMVRKMQVVLGVLFLAAGCGGTQPTNGDVASSTQPRSVTTVPTALETRRDAACKAIAPKLTECAVEDAKSDLAAGKVTKPDFDRDTAPEILRKNTDLFIEKCAVWRDISSRQVRVLEVCFKAELQCSALRDCLANLQAK